MPREEKTRANGSMEERLVNSEFLCFLPWRACARCVREPSLDVIISMKTVMGMACPENTLEK